MNARQTSIFGVQGQPVYCADTSAFVDLNRRGHSMEVFPKLWIKIDELINTDRLIAPKEVLKELKAGDDQLYRWVQARSRLLVKPDDDQQKKLREVMAKYPTCIKPNITKGFADPWVVAAAMTRSAVVLTFEQPKGTGSNKIPDICKQFGVKCVHPYQMFKDEGWKF